MVLLNLCGWHFLIPMLLPNLRILTSTPPISKRSYGDLNPTNNAGLSSILLFKYSCRCSLVLASKYTIRSLSPFPSTIHSRSLKSIFSQLSKTNSPTRIPVDDNKSIIARSLISSHESLSLSISSSEYVSLTGVVVLILRILLTGLFTI